jgi:hypothetical protein
MKYIYILALILTLIGCSSDQWYSAAQSYTCSTEQMSRVQAEAKWCKDNTSYNGEYCFGTTIMRICEKKKELR